ncbi:hypothetical protein Hypma_006214 [Hypsizygus marmoreus]|uniref:Uncharacterized protein n=1 Tax=Hypsizygus marmoreus TaxID=39966 RepID=A0A369JUS0_HYPMA|nr:hypothetical protein Hypma_006214 [Hypsizygus marmoreus]
MQHHSIPLVDKNNPLYCPAVTASAYLDSLRRHLQRKQRSHVKPTGKQHDRHLQSFALVLDRALGSGTCDSSDEGEEDQPLVHLIDPRMRTSSNEEINLPYVIPAWEHKDTDSDSATSTEGTWIGVRKRRLLVDEHRQPSNVKRKRTSMKDIRVSPEHARSIQSVHESSFELDIQHHKLSYKTFPGSPQGGPIRLALDLGKSDSALAIRVRELEDQLYGPPIGTESPRGLKPFIERLDLLLPGIRLKQRLSHLEDVSHQSIVDFLASHGLLNERVLSTLRSSEIDRIALTESLLDANGLNLGSKEILTTFSKPNSFLFLSELSLSGIHIPDFDITHIHRLPKLSTLLLDNTAISNEAIFLLVPLRRTLTQLSLASNPAIDDDAVPAILLLSKLSFLSILNTSIKMPGLRRLAKTIYHDDRVIDIEIPTACERYVDNMHLKYALDVRPPLIINPRVCAQLSSGALKRNLAAHAMANPDIIAEGGKAEMAERLRLLLETRDMDLLVRDMILGIDGKEAT